MSKPLESVVPSQAGVEGIVPATDGPPEQPGVRTARPPEEPAEAASVTTRVIIGRILAVAVPVFIWFWPFNLDATPKHALAITSFMIIGWMTEALDHGNTVEETDEAVLRMGLPMAPSVLLQLVGPKVANHVRHQLHDAWPDRFPLSETLESLAEGGDVVVVERAPRSVEELHEAVLEALADEARHILEDGVVAEAADIDTCLILGAGFPFWLGGITKHLDQTGVSERVVGRTLADMGAAIPADGQPVHNLSAAD